MAEGVNLAAVVAWCGFALAFVFGAVANRANFCTMGAIADIVSMGHWGRMRMWLLALAVAIAGTGALSLAGQVEIGRAIMQRPLLAWLSLALGGFAFGVGMTLAGGCANRNLVRLGSGSVRSLVVLVFMGLAAYMTLKGLFGQWRASLLDPVAIDLGAAGWKDQSLGTALARLGGIDARAAQAGAAALLVAALLGFVFAERRFRGNAVQIGAGIVIGLVVVAGWYVTGHLGYGENPETLETVFHGTSSHTIESMSFVAPIAYSLELLLLWTDKSLHPSFGVASAVGVVLGSATVALARGTFRWEGFASLADLRDQLVGALLMGFGGVTALGCTIGQGLSGLSTLALGSAIAVAGIIAGSVATLNYLLWRPEPEA